MRWYDYASALELMVFPVTEVKIPLLWDWRCAYSVSSTKDDACWIDYALFLEGVLGIGEE